MAIYFVHKLQQETKVQDFFRDNFFYFNKNQLQLLADKFSKDNMVVSKDWWDILLSGLSFNTLAQLQMRSADVNDVEEKLIEVKSVVRAMEQGF